MEVIRETARMKAWSRQARRQGLTIGFVPTMGFLHQGHLDLIRYAREKSDRVAVSIFVNPKQFGPKEDLADYPRDLDRDLDRLRPIGVDAVFNPAPGEIYPPGFQTRVEVLEVTKGLCGAFRPDFFPGVTTVVLKLFCIIAPDLAVFGEKDYQQLAAIKTMARDLALDVRVEGRPTVREPDGLAMSSRNTYLSPDERESALSLSQGLELARGMAARGEVEAAGVLAAVRAHIESRPEAKIQYAVLVDPDTLEEKPRVEGRTLLALAVFVGRTRLIDNAVLEA